MALRSVLTFQIGLDTIVLGPPSAFGGRSDGRQIGQAGVNGREDARRWIQRLCQEPGARNRIRQQMIHWAGDPHHLNRIPDSDLERMLVDLCMRGRLAMWACRPLGGQDAQAMSRLSHSHRAGGPVALGSLAEKIEWALRHAANEIGAVPREEYLNVTSPESLKVATGVMVLWTSSLAYGSGEIMDIVLQVMAAHRIDRTARDVADRLAAILTNVATSTNDEDLADAARHLGRFVVLIGVTPFLDMLVRAAHKASKGALKPKSSARLKNAQQTSNARI